MYLVNQLVDFDQTCTEVTLGWRKEVNRSDQVFKGAGILTKNKKIRQLEPNDGLSPNVLYHWGN